MNNETPQTIYLIPGDYDGQPAMVWSDCPAPGEGCDPDEAVRYVRYDRLAEVERERDALRMELDACRHTNSGLHKDKVHLAAMAGRLREELKLARANMEDWASYVDEYFRQKHDLAGDLASIDRALAETPPTALNKARCFSLGDANRGMWLPPGTKLYTHPQPAQQVPEDIRPEVTTFARCMQHKLDVNKHKDDAGWKRTPDGSRKGWAGCDMQFLTGKLAEECDELVRAIYVDQPNPDEICKEAADVGNIAMMIADNCGALRDLLTTPNSEGK